VTVSRADDSDAIQRHPDPNADAGRGRAPHRLSDARVGDRQSRGCDVVVGAGRGGGDHEPAGRHARRPRRGRRRLTSRGLTKKGDGCCRRPLSSGPGVTGGGVHHHRRHREVPTSAAQTFSAQTSAAPTCGAPIHAAPTYAARPLVALPSAASSAHPRSAATAYGALASAAAPRVAIPSAAPERAPPAPPAYHAGNPNAPALLR